MSLHTRLLAAADAAVHDAKSSAGSIRLVLTTLLDEEDDDREFLVSMLARADAETRRLAVQLDALPALVAALTDPSPSEQIDVAAATRRALSRARRSGIIVGGSVRGPMHVRGRFASTEKVIAVLIGLASGGAQPVRLTIGRRNGRVFIRLRSDATHTGNALCGHLIAAIGAEAMSAEGEIAFGWPMAS